MNEKDIQVQSRKVFIFMMLLFCFIGALFQSFAYPIGFFIGYIICYINFLITIQISDIILKTGHNVVLIIVMRAVKMILMTLGFYLGIIGHDWVNIFAVFFGYLVIPITIHWLNFKCRKEERR